MKVLLRFKKMLLFFAMWKILFSSEQLLNLLQNIWPLITFWQIKI